MQQDQLPNRSVLARTLVVYGMLSCVLQSITYLAGMGSPSYFGLFHLFLTLGYLGLSLLGSFYFLCTSNRSALILDATRWLATLLLTLPALLAELGLLAPSSSTFYQWILFPVSSQFFGLLPWMNNAAVFGFCIAFSLLELGILSCGAYRRKIIQ